MPATFSLLILQPQAVDLSQSDVCTYPIPLLLVAGSHWNVQLSTLPASRAIVGALFDPRAENRLPRKVALNERQTMFRVMNVRCSHRRLLAFFLPFSLFLSLVLCPHQARTSMTGDLRRCPRDPWVANQVLRRASTAAAPSSFISTVYFDGSKNDGPITAT